MNEKEEFFVTEDSPGAARSSRPRRKRGFLGQFGLMMLLGLIVLIIGLVVVDMTNTGGALKKSLIGMLGGETDKEVIVEKEVVEKEIEVPVEKVVEKVVEKIVEVEVKPPMPSSYVSWRKIDTAKLWSGIPVETKVVSVEGDTATKVREADESYQIEMTLKLTVPKANESVEELSAINENLPKMIPALPTLVDKAKVSPFYHHLYELKTERLQQKITRIDQLLSRHNFYDCETVLETTHPDSGRKLLLVQGEMDVVTDGSDGDRWPQLDDYISMSQYYQPFTSYGWGKRSSTPNPLLERWQTKLGEYEKEFAIPGLSVERNRYLRSNIETLKAEISDMKARSYLIAEADPFFVLPLSFLGRTDENEHAPSIGDYGVIIYGNKAYPTIAGDAGPSWKFGEASLRVAKELNEKATPYNRPVSDLEVTYLIFPGTRDAKKGPPDLEAWHARCSELLEEIGGLGEGFELHQWEDLIAKKKAEQEAATSPEGEATEGEDSESETATEDPPAQENPAEASQEAP